MRAQFSLLMAIVIFIVTTPVMAQTVFSSCGVKGSTTLYDLSSNRWVMTDQADADRQTLPASTFKIFHSLIALDTGATTLGEVFEWDGVEREFPIWNEDTTLEDAFHNSTIWVYEELANRIDHPTYQRYMHWADYEGNGDIEHGQDGNFWVYGAFGISPKDQIGMLVSLYKNELPFSRQSMNIVKSFMKEDEITYGKTGWTQHDGAHIGWWVGYRETSGGPIFFATRLTKPESENLGNFLECRKQITNVLINEYLKNGY